MGKSKQYRFPKSSLMADGMKHLYRQTPPNYSNSLEDDDREEYSACIKSDMFSPTDYLGSYTGVPADDTDIPIQDADDL